MKLTKKYVEAEQAILSKYVINGVLKLTEETLDEIIELQYKSKMLEKFFYEVPKESQQYKALCNIMKAGMVNGMLSFLENK